MPARLMFLGRLEDVAGGSSREVAPGMLDQVVALLEPALASAVSADRIRVALNGALVGREGIVLREGDELAFLPPVSGG